MIFRIAAAVAWLTIIYSVGMIVVFAAIQNGPMTHVASLVIGLGLLGLASIAQHKRDSESDDE